jgi:general secretion pathway protein G
MVFRIASGERFWRKRRLGGAAGFTLIELLVVMAIIAVLLTLAAPRYFTTVQKSKEAVLKQNLSIMREALDKYYGDKGAYPISLQTLVEEKYLRGTPVDPITGSTGSWVTVNDDDPDTGGIYDVHSGAVGVGRDGVPYREW